MSFLHYLDRIERIDQLIRLKATGTPAAFASRLGISERQLYYLLDTCKALGAPIVYDRYRKTYRYERPGSFLLRFQAKPISKEELAGRKGGLKSMFSSPLLPNKHLEKPGIRLHQAMGFI